MNKGVKFLVNLLVFAMVIGFGWYVFNTLGKPEKSATQIDGTTAATFINDSAYQKINTIQAGNEIITFDLYGDKVYMAAYQSIMIYDMAGTLVREIPSEKEIRDIKVYDDKIYLLHPDEIEVFTLEGEKIKGWPARRPDSDYCSLALSKEYLFATDAGNKNICKYTREGDYLNIIISPIGFVIPSYAFDIVNIRDTLYCGNSGRHRVESYTLEGQFITTFGKTGPEDGSFLGCCNPSYMTATQSGDILTSEKGNPRITCYSTDGTFRTVLLHKKALGGGTQAYKIKTLGERVFVAGKKTLSVYVFDTEWLSQIQSPGATPDISLEENI
ncbi:MAG: hypothetical protein LBE56_13040 [Tannerella sp.]|jgi:hypothetical protein|nr:hypothetical protein [Tannerella sp.]